MRQRSVECRGDARVSHSILNSERWTTPLPWSTSHDSRRSTSNIPHLPISSPKERTASTSVGAYHPLLSSGWIIVNRNIRWDGSFSVLSERLCCQSPRSLVELETFSWAALFEGWRIRIYTVCIYQLYMTCSIILFDVFCPFLVQLVMILYTVQGYTCSACLFSLKAVSTAQSQQRQSLTKAVGGPGDVWRRQSNEQPSHLFRKPGFMRNIWNRFSQCFSNQKQKNSWHWSEWSFEVVETKLLQDKDSAEKMLCLRSDLHFLRCHEGVRTRTLCMAACA